MRYVLQRCNKNNTSVYTLWHNRLGHPSEKVVKSVLQRCNIPLPVKMCSLCSACCLEKMHKFPYFTSSTEYNSPLQLIHSYLWVPHLTCLLMDTDTIYILLMHSHALHSYTC